MYTDLADWWPLFSPPSHYIEEAADLLPVLLEAPDREPKTLLELDCGGGSLANHLKKHLRLTLTDQSEAMIEVSRQVNPECEHLVGDMRSIEIGREFDLVFIHDAIMYATDPKSVQATLHTAYRHCRPGGATVVVPDFVKETFEPKTSTGGEDDTDGRGLRYLLWIWDPDPSDHTYNADFAFLLRDTNGDVHVDIDLHRFGLFPRAAWLDGFQEVGFSVRSRIDPWERDVFVAKKPA
jgi:SAM-dependent methyltransferase